MVVMLFLILLAVCFQQLPLEHWGRFIIKEDSKLNFRHAVLIALIAVGAAFLVSVL